jgi:hypothetical protein
MDRTNPPTWRKSTYSADSDNCVEVRTMPGSIDVRDSKNPDGGKLTVSAGEWKSFIARIKSGAVS